MGNLSSCVRTQPTNRQGSSARNTTRESAPAQRASGRSNEVAHRPAPTNTVTLIPHVLSAGSESRVELTQATHIASLRYTWKADSQISVSRTRVSESPRPSDRSGTESHRHDDTGEQLDARFAARQRSGSDVPDSWVHSGSGASDSQVCSGSGASDSRVRSGSGASDSQVRSGSGTPDSCERSGSGATFARDGQRSRSGSF